MDTANRRLIQITIVCICMMGLIQAAAVECERCNNQIEKDFRLYREILRQQGILMDYIFNRTKEAQAEQEAPTETSTTAPAITSTEAIDFVCNETYMYMFRNSCYEVVKTAMTWDDAQADCQSKGGFLAIVNDQETWDFVFRLIVKVWESIPSTPGVWLGATDQKNEGQWMWAKTGEPLMYTNWHEGNPSNSTDANCLQVFRTPGYSVPVDWGDTSCMSTKFFLCEGHV